MSVAETREEQPLEQYISQFVLSNILLSSQDQLQI
jgi:hypothetical protein